MPRNQPGFLSDEIWPELQQAALSTRCHVAVAYIGRDAPSLLPLQKDSILICDFSRSAVERGLTHPDALRAYLDAGVEIHSWVNLHAKVFSFGDVAYVGSCNASANSANVLTEAAVRIVDPKTVLACSEFVLSLRGSRVGPGLIDELAPYYRAPAWDQLSKSNSGQRTKAKAAQVPLWVADVSDSASSQARRQAKRNREAVQEIVSDTNAFELDWFEWQPGVPKSIRENSGEILMICDEGEGPHLYPPARFLRMDTVAANDSHIVWVEYPIDISPIPRKRAEKMLGSEFGERLSKTKSSSLIQNADFAKHLRQLW